MCHTTIKLRGKERAIFDESVLSNEDDEHYLLYHDKIHDVNSHDQQGHRETQGDNSALNRDRAKAIRARHYKPMISAAENHDCSGALQGPDPELERNPLGLVVSWRSD